MNQPFKVNQFQSPYIIAEIGANHNGDMELAKRMILKAKECGAHAAKFQSWTEKTLIADEEYERNMSYDDSPKKHFGSLREMVKKYELSNENVRELKAYCDEIGIDFSSTPFSNEECDTLVELGTPYIKVASMDVNNLPLLSYFAKQNLPIILSTGMASMAEIEQAIATIENEGNTQITLLHCISIYPPEYEDINLNNITMLHQTFGYPVGLSDHSIGTAIPLASVALGACVIEKHFTLDKDMPGWDHEISANPEELEVICRESININKSLGSFRRVVSKAEIEKRDKFRRSAVLKSAKRKGDVVRKEDLLFKRPGTGVQPDEISYLVGRTLNEDMKADAVLRWENLN